MNTEGDDFRLAPPMVFIRALCDALGLDHSMNITAITIHSDCVSMPTIRVERIPSMGELKRISDTVRRECKELGIESEIVELNPITGEVVHVLTKPKD